MAGPSLKESFKPHPLQVMSIEEVERILDETQEAVEYQRVGASRPAPHQLASAITSLVTL